MKYIIILGIVCAGCFVAVSAIKKKIPVVDKMVSSVKSLAGGKKGEIDKSSISDLIAKESFDSCVRITMAQNKLNNDSKQYSLEDAKKICSEIK